MISVSLSAWRLPLADAMAMAKTCYTPGVDLIAIPGWKQLDPARMAADPCAWADRIGRELRRHGLRATSLNAAVPDPHCVVSPVRRRTSLRQAEALAQIAARLGIGVVSLYPGYHHEGQLRLDALIRSCHDWVAIGRNVGVHLAPEIHWRTVAPDPATAAILCAQVPGLRLVVDPSHALVAGIPMQEWLPLLPKVVHVHLRDAARDRLSVPWGSGELDAPALLRDLRAVGYRGHIAVEYLPEDVDVWASLRSGLAQLSNVDNSHHGCQFGFTDTKSAHGYP